MSTLPPRKRKKKTKNQYFTQATEDAIVRYNESSDPEERSEIYRKDIHYAFFKLTENIIHTFKFYYTEVNEIEHLQHEVITFLLDKIHLGNRFASGNFLNAKTKAIKVYKSIAEAQQDLPYIT